MPSGNAYFTYTGEEPELTIQGQTFPKGEPQHVTDNGIIHVLGQRDDFKKAKAPKEAAE